MRLRTFAAGVALPLAVWGASPLVADAGRPGARAASLHNKIQQVQGKIGAKKGTERVLSTEIAGYSARIDRLQARSRDCARASRASRTRSTRNRAELAQIQADLRAERARLVRLRARLAQARAALAARLTEIYESDKPDLVTRRAERRGLRRPDRARATSSQRISEQDRSIVQLVKDARADAIATAQAPRRARAPPAAADRPDPRAPPRDHGRQAGPDRHARRLRGHARRQAQRADARARASATSSRATCPTSRPSRRRSRARCSAARASLPAGPIKRGGGTLIWPVNGPITSPFCESRAWESLPSRHRHRRPERDADPRGGGGHGRADPVRGAVGRLRQLHLRPAHRRAGHVLRAPVGVPRLDGPARRPGPDHRPDRLHRPLLRPAPALRGAHQRRCDEPARLPLSRSAPRDPRPRHLDQDVRRLLRAVPSWRPG